MKHIHCGFALLLLLAMPLCANAAEQKGPERIVVNKIAAVVNGEVITLHELRQHAGAELARAGINPTDPASRRQLDTIMGRVLSGMIDDMLLRQEAERLQVKVSEGDIDNEVRKLAQRNQITLKEFESRLVAQGGTMAMLRERVKNNILSQRIIGMQIARKSVVTEEEIKAYYEAHKGEFAAERTIDVSLIVFAPSADTADVYKKVKSGTLSFEDAARKFSEGPAPENGGRLGMIKWDELASPFKAQVMQLKDGDFSEVFQANGRYCMVKLHTSNSGRSMTLAEATPEIERILREPRLQERFAEYTEQLRSRAVIAIRL